MLAISTASVVVLNPPAVELGEPPISIRTVMVITDASESFVKSTVLKPAEPLPTGKRRQLFCEEPRTL